MPAECNLFASATINFWSAALKRLDFVATVQQSQSRLLISEAGLVSNSGLHLSS